MSEPVAHRDDAPSRVSAVRPAAGTCTFSFKTHIVTVLIDQPVIPFLEMIGYLSRRAVFLNEPPRLISCTGRPPLAFTYQLKVLLHSF
jgi:hypothetical protein